MVSSLPCFRNSCNCRTCRFNVLATIQASTWDWLCVKRLNQSNCWLGCLKSLQSSAVHIGSLGCFCGKCQCHSQLLCYWNNQIQWAEISACVAGVDMLFCYMFCCSTGIGWGKKPYFHPFWSTVLFHGAGLAEGQGLLSCLETENAWASSCLLLLSHSFPSLYITFQKGRENGWLHCAVS